MSRSRHNHGAYEVTGPDIEERIVPDVGTGLSYAQSKASLHLNSRDEVLTYYVRDLHGRTLAEVVKEKDGSVTTSLKG